MTQQKELQLRRLVMGNAGRMIYSHKPKGCLLKWSPPRVAASLIKGIRIPDRGVGVAERGNILNETVGTLAGTGQEMCRRRATLNSFKLRQAGLEGERSAQQTVNSTPQVMMMTGQLSHN